MYYGILNVSTYFTNNISWASFVYVHVFYIGCMGVNLLCFRVAASGAGNVVVDRIVNIHRP